MPQGNYISEGSVSHIDGAWPDFPASFAKNKQNESRATLCRYDEFF